MRDPSRPGSEPISRRGALASLAAAGIGSIVAGCGVSDYETRMEATIEDLELQSRFAGLRPEPDQVSDPEAAVGVVIALRLPRLLSPIPSVNAPLVLLKTGSGKPDRPDEPMPPERLLPPAPLPEIPGYQSTLENFVATSVGFRACYFYAGVEKADPATADAKRKALLQTVKANLTAAGQPDVAATANWNDVQVATPVPGAPKRLFRQLDVVCRQLFEVRGNVANEVIGSYRLLACELYGHQIFLGWRIPTTAFVCQSYLDNAIAAAGTLTVVAGKPAAAATAS